MAVKPKPVPGRKYSTFHPGPQTKGYAPGDVLKLGKNQVARFTEGLGYYAAPKAPVKATKPTVRIVRPTQTQDSFSTIESPAQIEARVKRMASESFTSSQKLLNDQADRLRKEAEGRRAALGAAYAEAARLNSLYGADVQEGWHKAAQAITGLAGTATGGVGDALRADLAAQEQALSRVGAGGTGFDATSQQQTEYFRGGGIPGEYDERMGGIGRQWLNEDAISLNNRGLQEGIAAENQDRYKINADLAGQIGTLTESRTKTESDLREQLLGAQSDQVDQRIKLQQMAQDEAIQKVKILQAQQKIDQSFKVALANATTSRQRAEVYAWKSKQDAILAAARNGIAQQNADSSRISANASATRAANTGNPKAATPATKRTAITAANKAGGTSLVAAINKIASNTPNFLAPPGTTQKEYQATEEYATAHREATRRAQLNFGTIMYRVIGSIGSYLREIGYTQNQIKREAYRIVSEKVDPPRSWLQANPGFGPKV